MRQWNNEPVKHYEKKQTSQNPEHFYLILTLTQIIIDEKK